MLFVLGFPLEEQFFNNKGVLFFVKFDCLLSLPKLLLEADPSNPVLSKLFNENT